MDTALAELQARYPLVTNWQQHAAHADYYLGDDPDDGFLFVRIDTTAGLICSWTAPAGTTISDQLVSWVYRRLGRTLRPAQRTAAQVLR